MSLDAETVLMMRKFADDHKASDVEVELGAYVSILAGELGICLARLRELEAAMSYAISILERRKR